VTVPPLEATDTDIDARIDRLREQFAELKEVERPARDGDLVTVDVHGVRDGQVAEGLSADDFVYEVGTGGIAEGVDEQLRGKKAGDIVDVDAPNLQGERAVCVCSSSRYAKRCCRRPPTSGPRTRPSSTPSMSSVGTWPAG